VKKAYQKWGILEGKCQQFPMPPHLIHGNQESSSKLFGVGLEQRAHPTVATDQNASVPLKLPILHH
jgi:hypothetical protein